ncbi:hypothetical protein Q8F55_001830 [Vanrija albida]|uniref:NAD-dependent epimerase/dehydratase domain-containing protein n=1 Tax=Vanrija albida TaxID=181172 RepID=A0ABR3Q8S8_9TREE
MAPPSPDKQSVVLILGGTTTVARALATYLLQGDEPRAQFVRLADRFSVSPPTTYIDKAFLELLRDDAARLEYRQVNLGNVERHADLFTPPAERGTHFDLVFDLTGEMGFDKPELLFITNTYQLALSLATSAARLAPEHRPSAYVRLQQPFYDMKSLAGAGHAEGDKLKPDGVRGRWWHETLRGIAQIPDLNFGVVRSAAWYGPGAWDTEVVPRLVVGHVYSYLGEEMKFLYNSDLRINTVHAVDIAQALYLTGLWLAATPRAQALKEAGVPLPFPFNPPSTLTFSLNSHKRTSSFTDTWKTVKTVVPEGEEVVAPLFNVTDDEDSTQGSLAKAVAAVWGVNFGFLSSTVATLVQQFAKTDFNEMVEDVNEKHVEAWSQMLAKSNPPIESTPISPFLDAHAFRKMAIHLDGSKARRVLGYKPARPRVEVDELKTIAQGFQKDNIWPTLS